MKLHRIALTALALGVCSTSGALAQNASLNPISGNVRLSSGFTPDPYRVSVIAGGGTDASRLGGSCRGSISDAPDFRLTYSSGSLPLMFKTEASSDTTLVVNGPDGSWYCDDDSAGSLNAQVTFNRPRSGVYDVWIGTYGGGLVSGSLVVTELTGNGGGSSYGPSQPQGAYSSGNGSSSGYPDSSLTANYATISLTSGFTPDPYRIDVTAGGGYDATGIGSPCVGKISSAPDVQVTYTTHGVFPLVYRTRSLTDTTLVVNGPDGRWYCNDDADGINAEVRFNDPQSGTYDIWVGTYGDTPASTTLSITETP